MEARPEFSRSIRIDSLGEAPRRVTIEAGDEERAALARRFGLVDIARLEAELSLTRSGVAIDAAGTLRAKVTQSCVATGDPVEAAIDEPFRIRFMPPPETAHGGEEEIELSEEDLDVVFYDGAAVDVGEAVAETLSLNLDPWPRAAGADDVLRAAGVKDEEEARAEQAPGPFSALSALKDKLE